MTPGLQHVITCEVPLKKEMRHLVPRRCACVCVSLYSVFIYSVRACVHACMRAGVCAYVVAAVYFCQCEAVVQCIFQITKALY